MRVVIEEGFGFNQVTVDNEELQDNLSIKDAKKCIDMLTDALDRVKELFDGYIF